METSKLFEQHDNPKEVLEKSFGRDFTVRPLTQEESKVIIQFLTMKGNKAVNEILDHRHNSKIVESLKEYVDNINSLKASAQAFSTITKSN